MVHYETVLLSHQRYLQVNHTNYLNNTVVIYLAAFRDQLCLDIWTYYKHLYAWSTVEACLQVSCKNYEVSDS